MTSRSVSNSFASAPEASSPDFNLDRHVQSLRTRGWSIIPNFLSPAQLHAAREALAPHRVDHRGRSNLEGYGTERVHTLVACGKVFEDITEEPRMLALMDVVLSPGYLLSISQAICIHPGEKAQPIHFDNSFYRIPRPRAAIGLSTIVAIDEFTANNGGTEIISGSHRWNDEQIAAYCDPEGNEVPTGQTPREMPTSVQMPAGACLVYFGTLLHRGGANCSDAPRLVVTNQYCEAWARTQENFFLAVPKSRVRSMSPRVQSLLGYAIHSPNMGHVTASHPLKTLSDDYVNKFAESMADG